MKRDEETGSDAEMTETQRERGKGREKRERERERERQTNQLYQPFSEILTKQVNINTTYIMIIIVFFFLISVQDQW